MPAPKTPGKDILIRDRAAYLVEMFLTYIADHSNDEHFGLVMKWFGEEGIVSLKDLADEFGVSEDKAGDWVSGLDRPHPTLRLEIFRWLVEQSNKYFK